MSFGDFTIDGTGTTGFVGYGDSYSSDSVDASYTPTQSYTGGNVIVGGGHYQSDVSPFVSSFYNSGPHVAVGGGHNDYTTRVAVGSAYNRTINASNNNIVRVNSEHESSAWENFREQNRHGIESAKELGLAYGSAFAGDPQGALEHGLNSVLEWGKQFLEDNPAIKGGLEGINEYMGDHGHFLFRDPETSVNEYYPNTFWGTHTPPDSWSGSGNGTHHQPGDSRD